MREIPNWLTGMRLGLIPLMVLLLINPSPAMVAAALCIFVIAGVTDVVDGFLARKFGAVSDFGKLLDPLADKLLVMSALIMLVSLRSDVYGEPWAPGWLVVLILAREIWVTGLRGLAASQGLIIAAGDAGKMKSLLQMIGIGLLFLHDLRIGLPLTEYQPSCQLVGLNLLIISVVLSYWGAAEYTSAVFFAHKGGKPAAAAQSMDVDTPVQ